MKLTQLGSGPKWKIGGGGGGSGGGGGGEADRVQIYNIG